MTAAGGWIYDRVTAGWDVSVLIGDVGQGRPLEVLGARVLDLASVLKHWEQRWHPQTIAVSAGMFDSHQGVQHGVLAALEHGRTEVTLWGAVPAELDPAVAVRQHRLSAAARAFKAQALLRAGADATGPVSDAEIFTCGVAAGPSVAADLSPAS
ncbi:hypothetical protein H7J77_15560 [Mycolicibacillus parakoreensis]|uniref:Uncharacterized protein n=1 Tax=Mycolicibacillus parakoreensis TaxID=1069221 RepID=A0ABY3TXG9_9MYCO|nr:hypothetical protein [Mycolicibacillus parakoreensis]MCV7316953.1 hypothetical protein [Mycolicibacillus parakoreensis]ULN51298.1 hypothetical protein MIU77_10155 [Mycolicibacillus parakoreensis]